MSIVNLLDNPKRVRESDWLLDNIGRISVALNTEESDIVDIIAYSDEKTDEKTLRVIAKEKNAHMIKNISENGANYIDEYLDSKVHA